MYVTYANANRDVVTGDPEMSADGDLVFDLAELVGLFGEPLSLSKPELAQRREVVLEDIDVSARERNVRGDDRHLLSTKSAEGRRSSGRGNSNDGPRSAPPAGVGYQGTLPAASACQEGLRPLVAGKRAIEALDRVGQIIQGPHGVTAWRRQDRPLHSATPEAVATSVGA
jgi:hypothetical protein